MRNIFLTSLAISCAVIAPSAAAQVGPPSIDPDATELYLGAAVLSSHDYAGADETQLRALPYFELYNFHGFDLRPFTATYDVIDIERREGLWAKGIKLGAIAAYDFGREEDDAPELSGLGDLDGGLRAGGYTQLRYGPVALRIEGGQDILDGHGGAQFDISIGTRLPVGDGSLTAALTSRWGSEDYNQSYFGITADQAAASQFNAHTIDSGVFSNGATLILSYPIGEKWNMTALASYQKYSGDAADSPIITAQTGSDSATTAVLAFSRKFDFLN